MYKGVDAKLTLELSLLRDHQKKEFTVSIENTGKNVINGIKVKNVMKKTLIFQSIQDNFKISIEYPNASTYTLTIFVKEIIPSLNPSIFNFANSDLKGSLHIKMYLFPLDVYILNYFSYTTLRLCQKNSENQNFFTIAQSIANEIIFYDQNANQRQLDSLYFAAATLFLFREANHISIEILNLIPQGIISAILFENKTHELKKIFLEEFRDPKMQIINREILIKNGSQDTNQTDEISKKMKKYYFLRTNVFIIRLEKLLLEVFSADGFSFNQYPLHFLSGDIHDSSYFEKAIEPTLINDIYSFKQFSAKLVNTCQNYNKIMTEYNQIIKKIEQKHFSSNKKDSVIIKHFTDLVLEVDLNPDWCIPKSEKKDQILSSGKKGSLVFKHKYMLFKENESKLEIKIPYRIIDSFTDIDHEMPDNEKINDNEMTEKKTKKVVNQDTNKSTPNCFRNLCKKTEEVSEKELDSLNHQNSDASDTNDTINNTTNPNPTNNDHVTNDTTTTTNNNDHVTNDNNNTTTTNDTANVNANNGTITTNIDKNSNANNNASDGQCTKSLYIYDGSQLYTFSYFTSGSITICKELLMRYTKKTESDAFHKTLLKSWKKDQMYVLQTESFKRLVKEPGRKIKYILVKLLNPSTYQLSDIIILQNSCIQREDVAIDTLEQIKSKWKEFTYIAGENELKIQLIKVTKKIFTEKVAVSSKRLFKDLMDWIESLHNSYFILFNWTEIGQKANKMYQKMKNYSMVNIHQISPTNATEHFNEQLMKPYLVKYAQLPED